MGPKSVREQINLLEQRGLIFECQKDRENFADALHLFNYINLVENQKHIFYSPENDLSIVKYKTIENDLSFVGFTKADFERQIVELIKGTKNKILLNVKKRNTLFLIPRNHDKNTVCLKVLLYPRHELNNQTGHLNDMSREEIEQKIEKALFDDYVAFFKPLTNEFSNLHFDIYESDTYDSNINAKELVETINFDNEIKGLLFEFILKIEKKFQANVAHHTTLFNRHNNFEPSEQLLLIDSKLHNRVVMGEKIDRDVIKKMSTDVKKFELAKKKCLDKFSAKNKQYMQIYGVNEEKKHELPFWVWINSVTYGALNNLYINLNNKIKNQVSKYMKSKSPEKLYDFNRVLIFYRNIMAHGELFYIETYRNLKFNTSDLKRFFNKKYFKFDPISEAKPYMIFYIVEKLLSRNDGLRLFQDTNSILSRFRDNVSSSSFYKITNEMGFSQAMLNKLLD